jgi:hypothetical protein
MSIKDEIQHVKAELSSDEKLLENAFKLERLYKKYKLLIWGAAVLAVVGFGGNAAWQWYQQTKRDAANAAWLTLKNDPKNTEALATLKSNNPDLYALYRYAEAVRNRDTKTLRELSGSGDAILADLSGYHAAVLDNRTAETTLYHDLSVVESAWLDLKAGNKSQARNKLSVIAENSPVAKVAQLLRHYTLESK